MHIKNPAFQAEYNMTGKKACEMRERMHKICALTAETSQNVNGNPLVGTSGKCLNTFTRHHIISYLSATMVLKYDLKRKKNTSLISVPFLFFSFICKTLAF